MTDKAADMLKSAAMQFAATGAVGLVLWYAAFEVKFARAEERIEQQEERLDRLRGDIVRRLERIEDKLDRVAEGAK